MPKLMGYVIEFNDVGKRKLFEHECDPHSFIQTRTHKGGWFGLTFAQMPNCNLAKSIYNKWLQESRNKGGDLYMATVDDYI